MSIDAILTAEYFLSAPVVTEPVREIVEEVDSTIASVFIIAK